MYCHHKLPDTTEWQVWQDIAATPVVPCIKKWTYRPFSHLQALFWSRNWEDGSDGGTQVTWLLLQGDRGLDSGLRLWGRRAHSTWFFWNTGKLTKTDGLWWTDGQLVPHKHFLYLTETACGLGIAMTTMSLKVFKQCTCYSTLRESQDSILILHCYSKSLSFVQVCHCRCGFVL